ncbi:MAG: Holliday junction branch migration protein RuvA [Phycisphaerae bacterium]
MIARITGKLLNLSQEDAQVEVGALVYEVMLPGYCVSALAGRIGEEVILHTTQYYEGTPGGGNLIPRLIGFLSEEEKQFFAVYTSVKGMGTKKGLKSLALPVATVAGAIESGDDKIIISLPGIGKRLAQLIIAELSGKLTGYIMGSQSDSVGKAPSNMGGLKAFQLEALEILVAWGEKRLEAIELINLACERHPDIATAEELVPSVYKLKQGIEV